MITLSDIQAARTRISPYILPTPLLRIPALDAALGCRVYLKLESLQRTGSFKLRGALNALLCLTDAQRTRGVVASSSGNHAQGVACAGQLLGVDVTIVMPTNCNPTKLAGVKSYGARVLLEGTLSTERMPRLPTWPRKAGWRFTLTTIPMSRPGRARWCWRRWSNAPILMSLWPR